MPGLGEVTTTQIRISAEEMLLAAAEGGTVTYSHVVADNDAPTTHNTVVEFEETPEELKEAIKDNGALINRLGGVFDE